MPNKIVHPVRQKKGSKLVEDNGWCYFVASEEYRSGIDDIFGKRCIRCRDILDDKGKEFCSKCEIELEGC